MNYSWLMRAEDVFVEEDTDKDVALLIDKETILQVDRCIPNCGSFLRFAKAAGCASLRPMVIYPSHSIASNNLLDTLQMNNAAGNVAYLQLAMGPPHICVMLSGPRTGVKSLLALLPPHMYARLRIDVSFYYIKLQEGHVTASVLEKIIFECRRRYADVQLVEELPMPGAWYYSDGGAFLVPADVSQHAPYSEREVLRRLVAS
jgi:hypothetical protein